MDRPRKKTGASGATDNQTMKEDQGNQTESSPLSSEKHSQSTLNDAPEGGWGWVVLIASLFNTFILDGIGGSFGLLYPYILDKFNASASVTTLAGSLFVSYMMMGSLAAWLVDRLGYRAVAMAGGVLCCLSFVAAAFCTNVYAFILTFGLMAGCSTGLVYLPSVVVVNCYFNKRRGLANGIVSSGAGAGLVVLAPLVRWLLDTYSLDGTILILAGIALNMSMFSSLFLPVKHSSTLAEFDSSIIEPTQNSERNEWESYSGIPLSQEESDKMESPDWEDVKLDKYIVKIRETDPCKAGNSSSRATATDNLDVSRSCHHLSMPSNKPTQSTPIPIWASERSLFIPVVQRRVTLIDAPHSMDNVAFRSRPPYNINIAPKVACIIGRTSSLSQLAHGSHLYLAGSMSILQNTHNKYLQRSQMSSLHALPSHTIHSVISHEGADESSKLNQDGSSFDITITEDNDTLKESYTSLSSKTKTRSKVLLDNSQLSLFMERNATLRELIARPVFLVFCCGACLIQIGYPIIGIFLVDYANEQGVSSSQSAYLMSIMGAFNIVGRLLSGSLASVGINPLLLNDVMLFLGAVVCLLFPLYTSFWPLCVFAALFGFLLGFFPPLQPLIIVEYFGIASLGSAFGFLSMVKGLATMAGPPMAGWIYDSCHLYAISIVFAGSAFLLSSIVHQTMTCFKQR